MATHLATGECEASCRRCLHSTDCREVWGCDRPTVQPWFEIDCPACGGARPTCEECGGDGRIGIDRCPNVTVPDIYRRVVASAIETEQGVWPERGGTLDQSAWFVAAREHVLRIVNEWRKRQRSTSNV